MMNITNKIRLAIGTPRQFGTTARSFENVATARQATPSTMKAWQIERYGTTAELTLSTAPTPILRNPDDILIEVHAASVNPIDTRMLEGYGRVLFNTGRMVNKCKNNFKTDNRSEFPLILGRDCSGVVRETGRNVPPSSFKPGDEVWTAVHAVKPGTHAEYVLSSASEVAKKPSSLSHTQAASIPYVAGTTFTALRLGCLNEKNARNKKVLIFGGSGGIGTFAIQLLKAWGASVVCTCSPDAIDMTLDLGADVALSYRSGDVMEELKQLGGFNFILDNTGKYGDGGCRELLEPNGTYVTLVSPMMRNTDQHGLIFGVARSVTTFSSIFTQGLVNQGKQYRWAFFTPSGAALEHVAKLVDNGQIRPVIEEIVPFRELPRAFKKVSALHNRGKTVTSLTGKP